MEAGVSQVVVVTEGESKVVNETHDTLVKKLAKLPPVSS